VFFFFFCPNHILLQSLFPDLQNAFDKY